MKPMKTNKEKNLEHDARMQERVRPKQKEWDFEPLAKVIQQWKARANEQA
jgi:hypothetical protein